MAVLQQDIFALEPVEVVVLECGNEHGNERNKFELLELVFLGNNFCRGTFSMNLRSSR